MKVLIWGTGKYYTANRNNFREDIDIIGFVDNNREKQGTQLDGKKIYAPSEINNVMFDYLFILCKDYISVRKQIMEGVQLPENIKVFDVTQIEVFCNLENAILYNYAKNRICNKKILAYSLSLASTGAQNVMFIFFQILYKNFPDCNITVVSKGDGPLRDRLKELGISVIITPDFRADNPELINYIQEADFILVNTIWLAYVTEDLIKYQKNIMWWLHESAMLSYIDVQCIRRIMSSECVKIYAVSRVVKQYIEKQTGIENKIKLFSFGIPEYFENKSGKLIFAIIGGLGYIKGQDIFVDAVELLPQELKSKAEFWIIGGGTLEASVIDKVLKIPEVIIKGEIDNRMMKYIYDQIDVIVSCSREESMSLAVMEGFMNSKLGIVSDRAGISDFITDGVNGFVIDNDNTKEYTEKMAWVINNPDAAKRIGEKSREIYENNFSMKAFNDRVVELMKTIF